MQPHDPVRRPDPAPGGQMIDGWTQHTGMEGWRGFGGGVGGGGGGDKLGCHREATLY